MKTTTTVLNVIANLNLEPIKNKLMDPEDGEGWSRAKVEAMDLEYRRFLHLMHTFPNQSASPTKAVDTFWHYHILDTQRYAADCEEVFGCFMHHNPYGDGDGTSTGAYNSAAASGHDPMQDLYESTFGEAYIRRESYYADEVCAEAAGGMGQAAGKQAVCKAIRGMHAKPADAKSAVCQCACGMLAKSAGAKAAVCQCACGMLAESAGAKAAVCQCACGMLAKSAGAKAAVCQCACGMQAKSAGAKAAVCQCACGMQAKSAGAKAAVCQCACGMLAKSAGAKAAVCQCACGMLAKPAAQKAVSGAIHV